MSNQNKSFTPPIEGGEQSRPPLDVVTVPNQLLSVGSGDEFARCLVNDFLGDMLTHTKDV